MKKFTDYLEESREILPENREVIEESLELFGIQVVLTVGNIIEIFALLSLIGFSAVGYAWLWLKEYFRKKASEEDMEENIKKVTHLTQMLKDKKVPEGTAFVKFKDVAKFIKNLSLEEKRQLKKNIEEKIGNKKAFSDVVQVIDAEVSGFKNIKTKSSK